MSEDVIVEVEERDVSIGQLKEITVKCRDKQIILPPLCIARLS